MTRLQPEDRGRDIARWIVLLPAAVLTFLYLTPLLTSLYNLALNLIPFSGPVAPTWWIELILLASGAAGAVAVGASIAPRFRMWVAVVLAALIVLGLIGITALASLHGLMNWHYLVGSLVRGGAAIVVAFQFANEK